jgi:hypothetical protein
VSKKAQDIAKTGTKTEDLSFFYVVGQQEKISVI